MNFQDVIHQPGEHPLVLPLASAAMESILSVPPKVSDQYVAILGHPHSLHGGTMNNKVVTTMSRAFNALGIANIRFNFRGVGQSEGTFDNGLGESDDMIEVANCWLEPFPDMKLIFAGFSFGSFVAYRAAAQMKHALLITIAPSVVHFDYQSLPNSPENWFIVQGDKDDIVDEADVRQFASSKTPPLPVVYFKDTGHFFHGKLIELKNCLMEEIKQRVAGL